MNQQLAKTESAQALALARAERRQAIAVRVESLQLSPLTNSVLLAKLTGTPLREATDSQLASMWTEVTRLLRIEFIDQAELDQFDADLFVLNGWVRREIGPRGMTVEDVTRAYNHLVNHDLNEPDGKTLKAYPLIDPKHCGEVLAAYRTFVNSNTEANEVLSKALYLPESHEPTEDDVDTQMEQQLRQAVDMTRNGGLYYDLGNGLYMWLWGKRRINNTLAEWEAAVAEATKVVPTDIAEQKEQMHRAGQAGLRDVLEQRLKAAQNAEGNDYRDRVRAHAYRILLVDYLRLKAGGVLSKPGKGLPATPKLPIVDNTPPQFKHTPFDHYGYVRNLREQLPTMDGKALDSLKADARSKNYLDVYELVVDEQQNRKKSHGKKRNQPERISGADWGATWDELLPEDYEAPAKDQA